MVQFLDALGYMGSVPGNLGEGLCNAALHPIMALSPFLPLLHPVRKSALLKIGAFRLTPLTCLENFPNWLMIVVR